VQKERKDNGDPELISDLVSSLIQERDWKGGIAEGTLYTTWPDIVGSDIASHTTPLSILDGVLTVQTSSTAWATDSCDWYYPTIPNTKLILGVLVIIIDQWTELLTTCDMLITVEGVVILSIVSMCTIPNA
jgi:hypothetical protein